MTALDTRLRATAERLIAKYGKPMTLRRMVTGTYDASTATAPVTPTDYAVTGVLSTPVRIMFENGMAKIGDMTVLLAAKALSAEPLPGDVLVDDDVVWQVVPVRKVYSGEQVCLYEILARK